MNTILIIEDVPLVAERIADLCHQHFQYCDVHLATSIQMAKKRLSKYRFDLVLLDLNLNGDDGFSLLKHASPASFPTIVITATPERAATAFDYGVLDFITKPVTEKRFKQAMQRFKNSTKNCQQQISQLLIKHCGKVMFIQVEDIHFIQAAGNYTEIITYSNQSFLHDKNMEQLSYMLVSKFIRIHRSYLVEKNKIRTISNYGSGKYRVTLESGKQLPLSRNVYKTTFKDS
ncbi:LytR/AlgR family response regulator transcription factor [Aliikangiella sp. IMCC44653]